MFKPKRIAILVLAAIVLEVLLYLIDNDSPTDGLLMTSINAGICFVIVLVFYSVWHLCQWLFVQLTRGDEQGER
jgi:hypothetical protein